MSTMRQNVHFPFGGLVCSQWYLVVGKVIVVQESECQIMFSHNVNQRKTEKLPQTELFNSLSEYPWGTKIFSIVSVGPNFISIIPSLTSRISVSKVLLLLTLTMLYGTKFWEMNINFEDQYYFFATKRLRGE